MSNLLRERTLTLFCLLVSTLSHIYHHTPLVGATVRANTVGWTGCAALWTGGKACCRKRVVRSSVSGMSPRVAHVYNHSVSTISYFKKKVKSEHGLHFKPKLLHLTNFSTPLALAISIIELLRLANQVRGDHLLGSNEHREVVKVQKMSGAYRN